MKLSHKLVMVSAAALMGVSPAVGSVVSTNVAFAATKKSTKSTRIYKTMGKNSRITPTKNTYFVDNTGKKTSKRAYKNSGKYIIWDVKEVNGETYFSIQTDLKYWIPASATRGSVQYQDGDKLVTITTDGKKVVQTEKAVKSSSKKSTKKASTKSTKKTTKSTKADSKKSTAKSDSKKSDETSTKKSSKSTSKKTTDSDSTKKSTKSSDEKATSSKKTTDSESKSSSKKDSTKDSAKSDSKKSTKSDSKVADKKSEKTSSKSDTKKSSDEDSKESTQKASTKSTKKTTKSTKADSKKSDAKSEKKSDDKTTSSKKSTKKTIKVTNIVAKRKAQVYDKNGNKAKTYMGSKKWTIIGKGVQVKGLGTKTINGVKYYALQPNHYYVKASDFNIKK